MARIYGWQPDSRFRVAPNGATVDLSGTDRKFSDLAAKLNMRLGAGDVDLSLYCVAMDQYQLSSCTGNATCESLEILENISAGQATVLSRLFTYAMARTIDGTLTVDGGSQVRSCFESLTLYGVCTEALWPYDTSKVDISPSISAQQQAVGHKIHSYYRIDSQGSQRLTDIQTALYNKHPVVFGTTVGTAFENLPSGSNGPLGIPMDAAGGHALVIVGYVGGNYVVKNSWGTSWGSNGFCQFTPDYVMWAGTNDLWVPTLAPVF